MEERRRGALGFFVLLAGGCFGAGLWVGDMPNETGASMQAGNSMAVSSTSA